MSLCFAHYNFTRIHKTLRGTPTIGTEADSSRWALEEPVVNAQVDTLALFALNLSRRLCILCKRLGGLHSPCPGEAFST